MFVNFICIQLSCHDDAILLPTQLYPAHIYLMTESTVPKFSSHSAETRYLPNQIAVCNIKPWFFKPKKAKFRLQNGLSRSRKFNSLHWSDLQNRKYVDFLISFHHLIKGAIRDKRKYHLNRMMSKHIGTRSPVQCRSHHQKMIKTFKNNEGIISHFQDCFMLIKVDNSEKSSSEQRKSNMAQGSQTAEVVQEVRNSSDNVCNSGEGYYPDYYEPDMWDILTFPLVSQNHSDPF